MDEMDVKMYYAISYNDPVSVEYLIRQGANVNQRFLGMNHLGKTPLHLCCETGQYECAQILLKGGARVTLQDDWFQTPLMYSVMTGHSQLTQLMVETGRGLNVHDRHGRTALHIAITNAEDDCLQELFKGNVNVDETDELGRTPLWTAASNKNCRNRIQWLIEANCDVNKKDINEFRTPLQVAIHKGEALAYVELLLAAGANPDTCDVWGHTPLLTLIWKISQEGREANSDDLKLAGLLVESGCDVNRVTEGHEWKGTALHMAVEKNNYKMVEFLLSAGADPNITEGHLTALHLAAGTNNMMLAKCLLNANCTMNVRQDVKIREDFNKTLTPFGYALYKGHPLLAKMILHAGYDLKLEDYLWSGAEIPEILLIDPEFWFWLQGFTCSPRRLYGICQIFFRLLFGSSVEKSISELPLPNSLKDAILLNNFLDDNP